MHEISRKAFLNPPALYIHENGYVDLDTRWHSDLSLDPYSCFYLVEAGEGFLIHNGERIEMKPGNADLIPPNTPFSYGCPDRLVKLYVHFNMVGSDGLDALRNLRAIHACPLLPGELAKLLSLYPQSSLSDAYAFRHLLYGVIARMLATYPEEKMLNKSYSPLVSRAMKYIDENIKAPYFPQVSLGWDSNPRYNVFRDDVCTENTPENVKRAFEEAKAYIDSHPELPVPLITVNSWNEWTETSYLHPDDLYGYGYLEAVHRVFCE